MTKLMELVMGIDPKNAEYIVNNDSVKSDYEMAKKFAEGGNTDTASFCMAQCIQKIKEFDGRYLTPANVNVGDGVTVCLWSDRHAATIIKVTPKTVTIQYDKATLDPNFKPEFIAGGFAGHCINQDEQSYTYERNPDGAIETFHWSGKYNSYGTPNNPKLIKGRHEFYDYNF